MRSVWLAICAVVILTAGCATLPPFEKNNSYKPVKTCDNKNIKIDFFVPEQFNDPDEDILTKDLIIKIKIYNSNRGKATMWLYYKEMNPPEKRNLPEHIPEKVVVETKTGNHKVTQKDFTKIWLEFMSPRNLTFIENCLFD